MRSIIIRPSKLIAFLLLSTSALIPPTLAYAECVGANTCYGTGALQQDTADLIGNNSAFGYRSLNSNTDGGANTAVGADALQLNTTGFENTAVGNGALNRSANGSENTAVGFQALFNSLGASENTALGHKALFSTRSGFLNVAVGYQAMLSNTSGRYNTAVGSRALSANTTGGFNSAFGMDALENNTTGTFNTALGIDALFQNETGVANSAVGANALSLNTVGSNNTGLGEHALYSNDSGNDNTASGTLALYLNESGSANTAIGVNALTSNTTGNSNTSIGVGSLKTNVAGFRNVAIGYQAGFATTGSDNIVIGGSNQGKPAENGTIRIGASANQKKTFIAGISGVKTGLATAKTVFIDANGQLGTVKSSVRFKEDIQTMGSASERLMSLRPVTFRYKEHEEDGSQPVQYGLIAEEVAEAFPELVVNDLEGQPETVRYDLLATLLVNEYQKQRRAMQAQAERIATLESHLAELAKLVNTK